MFNMDITLFSGVSDQDRILFARHMALMSRSGIGLSESIEVLIRQTKSQVFRHILQSVRDDLENGQSLSKALARYPKVFDPFYTNLIEIGEESGNLSKNLAYLAEQLEKNREFRGKMKSAMLYPSIVVSLAIVVGIGVSVFALPQLINMFESFNVPLPLNTRILIAFAAIMRDYGLFMLGCLIALIIVFRILINIPRIRFVWQSFLLKTPLAGPIIQNTQLTLLCRNLGVMVRGGVPITTALDIQTKNTGNLVYRKYIVGIRKAIGEGKTIASQFLLGEYRDIPPIVAKMVDVGEKSGKLDETFIYLSDFFEAEVDETTKNISIVMEPILLFVIAGIVAFVALSIITPIYQLTGSITPNS